MAVLYGVYYSMSEVVVIISESLTTSFLLLLVALSYIQDVIFHKSTSVLDHMPYVNRNDPFCYIFLLYGKQSLISPLYLDQVVIVNKERVRSFEILAIAAQHNHLEDVFFLNVIIILEI